MKLEAGTEREKEQLLQWFDRLLELGWYSGNADAASFQLKILEGRLEQDALTVKDREILIEFLKTVRESGEAEKILNPKRKKPDSRRSMFDNIQIALEVINQYREVGHLDDNQKEPGAIAIVAKRFNLSDNKVWDKYKQGMNLIKEAWATRESSRKY